ncbi:MAG TPA: S26 family signal peptidase, partial [Phycisphaerae bacterium]|nr:S26 family signal peptidase [Phycisphaerae bacterium]
MRDAIEEYLDRVMAHTYLSRHEQARVRAELKDHLAELVAEAGMDSSDHKEITVMLENEFGKPETVGKGISNAKGRVRTWLKKFKRGPLIAVAAGLVLNFSIRWAVAEPFYVPGKGAEPLIPQGSRVLVYKLASVFRAGDVVAFRNLDGEILLGIVKTEQGG